MRNRAETEIVLQWIRHGKTKSNIEHRYLGKTEEPLSKEGKQALEKQMKAGMYQGCDVVFVSPMKRCIETAELLYPDRNRIVISEWEEMDFGAFEGKNYQELQKDPRYQQWIDSNGTLPFPEGESREQFLMRCKSGWDRMVKILRETDAKQVAIVVHGGTIMAVLSTLHGGEYFDYQVTNGDGYTCTAKFVGEQLNLIEVTKGFPLAEG